MSRWIDIDDDRNCYIGNDGEYERWNIDPDVLDEAKPTFEPERKKGRWEVAIGYDQNKKVMCTECRLMSYEPTPFCPNCGAEMGNKDD